VSVAAVAKEAVAKRTADARIFFENVIWVFPIFI
jgi:hypothetical protein